MTDVHLFGDIGGRIVDDDTLGFLSLGDPGVGIGDEIRGHPSQNVGAQAQVDESGPGDLGGFAQILDI